MKKKWLIIYSVVMLISIYLYYRHWDVAFDAGDWSWSMQEFADKGGIKWSVLILIVDILGLLSIIMIFLDVRKKTSAYSTSHLLVVGTLIIISIIYVVYSGNELVREVNGLMISAQFNYTMFEFSEGVSRILGLIIISKLYLMPVLWVSIINAVYAYNERFIKDM